MNPVFQLPIIILAFLYPLHSASAFVRLHTPNNGRFLSKNCQILVPCRMTLTPEDSNTVWQYVKKPLISVGGKGATIKHGNSLRQLLDDHTVVKVKVNTKSFGTLEKAHDVLRGLAIESGASEDIEMIQMREKDRIIMYGLPGTLENIKNGSFPNLRHLRIPVTNQHFTISDAGNLINIRQFSRLFNEAIANFI